MQEQGLKPESEDSDTVVFRRILKKAKKRIRVGVKVSVQNMEGLVDQLVYDPKEVQWLHGKPYFIGVSFSNGKYYWCHPNQLKVIK